MVDEPTSSLTDANDAGKSRDAFRSAFGFDDAMDSRWMEIAREATTETTSLGRLGRYELLAEAGRGGQGIVYKAKQPGTNRTIAIKRLAAGVHASDASRARFHREVSLVASLDHPGIVSVLGMEDVPGELGTHELLLMEWVDGVAIDQWADSQTRWQEVLPVFVQVCDAVAFAHQRGVMHRDLKPSNIMVDGTGRARVLDFGLARTTGPNLTISRTTGFVGTPAYASPEAVGVSTSVFSGNVSRNGAGTLQGIDTRSDIFSLGAVLYRLLTKREPFDSSKGIGPLFDAIRLTEPSSLRSIVRDIPRELEAIVLKALRKSPSDRYQSVDAFATDLRRFLAGETVVAVPPSLRYQLRSLVRRHRAASVVAVAGLVGVLLFAGTATWLAIKLGKERDALAAAQVEIKKKSSEVEAALRDALTKGEQHQSTSAFLESILSEIDNLQERDRAVTLRELLERAVQRLRAGELANQPGEQAKLFLTLAEAMRGIGQNASGLQLAQEAMSQTIAVFGAHSLEAMRAHHVLGLHYESLSDPVNSLAHYVSYEQLAHEFFGPMHEDSIKATHNTGVALRAIGKNEEALERHCDAWSRRAELFGESSDAAIASERGVAMSYRGMRDTKTSMAVARDALARATIANSPLRIRMAHLVAAWLDAKTQFEEYRSLQEWTLRECRSSTPINTSELIRCLQNVAQVNITQDKPVLALPFLEESVSLAEETFGKDHSFVARTRMIYAQALCAAGRQREGLQALQDLRDATNATSDNPNNRNYLELTDAIATELRKAGELELALSYREEYAEAYTYLTGQLDRSVPRWETMAQEARDTSRLDKHEYALARALECELASRARPSKLVDLCLSLAEIRAETGDAAGSAEALAQAATFAGEDAKLKQRIADSLVK